MICEKGRLQKNNNLQVVLYCPIEKAFFLTFSVFFLFDLFFFSFFFFLQNAGSEHCFIFFVFVCLLPLQCMPSVLIFIILYYCLSLLYFESAFLSFAVLPVLKTFFFRFVTCIVYDFNFNFDILCYFLSPLYFEPTFLSCAVLPV